MEKPKYELTGDQFEYLRKNKINRSKPQLNQLYELCDGDFEKLKKFEYVDKNNHLGYFVSTKEEVEDVLNQYVVQEWFKFDQNA